MTVPPWRPEPMPYLYEQVAAHIEARIDAGDLVPGQRLPPEPGLAAEYGVAYHTIRNAMRLLRERGRIITLHGRGTFVAGRQGQEEIGGGGRG